ncbi:autoinducer binding domain-containing protein [Legionella lytica]|uniref:Autoinducer binding domain-containing protein n=1 Tax=Legionella lytica TaxID=96232 RepID=A0ABY4Y5W3_9GAMM|nr:autoinducer binding domain-containing protein [Legionella lytica]USQ12955.1 autoinducer binding domain-containing protein [Legionella lytica]
MDVSKQQSSYLHSTFPEQFELQFYKNFHSLKRLGCDYFYFLGFNSGQSHRFCTDSNWIDFYYDEKFILDDPLKRIAEASSFIALPWSQITFSKKSEKKAIEGRLSFGLYNGITITRERNNKKYIFALSTEEMSHDLARYLLLEKSLILEDFLTNCMQLFDQYLFMISKDSSLTLN